MKKKTILLLCVAVVILLYAFLNFQLTLYADAADFSAAPGVSLCVSSEG